MDPHREQDPAAVARAIIDANLYMTLGTAAADGTPWVSPVYFAPVGYGELLWVSSPEARHSRNIGSRPEVAIVIFDSTVPIATGQGVYMSATARELSAGEIDDRLEVYSRRAVGHGGRRFALGDVRAPAPFRLYAASVSDHFVLEAGHDRRLAVSP